MKYTYFVTYAYTGENGMGISNTYVTSGVKLETKEAIESLRKGLADNLNTEPANVLLIMFKKLKDTQDGKTE